MRLGLRSFLFPQRCNDTKVGENDVAMVCTKPDDPEYRVWCGVWFVCDGHNKGVGSHIDVVSSLHQQSFLRTGRSLRGWSDGCRLLYRALCGRWLLSNRLCLYLDSSRTATMYAQQTGMFRYLRQCKALSDGISVQQWSMSAQ